MYLQSLYNRAHSDKLTQTLSAKLRHGKLFLHQIVNVLYLFIISVRDFNQLTAPTFYVFQHILTDKAFRPFLPVIPVDNIIRAQAFHYMVINHLILYQNLMHKPSLPYHLHPFLQGNGGKPVKSYHGSVRKHSYRYFPIFGGFS